MKYALFLGALIAASAAHAQINPLGAGAATITTLLLKSGEPPEEQPETLYVTPTAYQGQQFPRKRTPSFKLPGAKKGGPEIKAIEQYLSGRYAVLRADTTALLLAPDQEKEFNRLRAYLEANFATWNTTPYTDEINFYRQHDAHHRLTQTPAR